MAGRANVPKYERTLRALEQPPRDRPVASKPPLLDAAAAAAFLNVSESYIATLTRTRKLGFVKVGKFNRFEQEELFAFIERGRVEPNQSSS